MKKRTYISIFLCFIVFPALLVSIDYIRIDVLKINNYNTLSFLEQYKNGRWKFSFIQAPLSIAILILLPYNIIFRIGKKKNLPLILKFFTFLGLLVFWSTVLLIGGGMWLGGWIVNVKILTAFVLTSLLFVLPIHYWVDQKEID